MYVKIQRFTCTQSISLLVKKLTLYKWPLKAEILAEKRSPFSPWNFVMVRCVGRYFLSRARCDGLEFYRTVKNLTDRKNRFLLRNLAVLWMQNANRLGAIANFFWCTDLCTQEFLHILTERILIKNSVLRCWSSSSWNSSEIFHFYRDMKLRGSYWRYSRVIFAQERNVGFIFPRSSSFTSVFIFPLDLVLWNCWNAREKID